MAKQNANANTNNSENNVNNLDVSKPAPAKVSSKETEKKIKSGNNNISEEELKSLFASDDFKKDGKVLEYSVMKKEHWMDLIGQEVKIIFLGVTGTFENDDLTSTRYVQFHSNHENKEGKIYTCALSGIASPLRNGGKGMYKAICKGETLTNKGNLMVDLEVKLVNKF